MDGREESRLQSGFYRILDHDKTVGLVVHEVMHNAMGHPWRRDARDHSRFNAACDYAINGELQSCGFSLPAGGLFPDASQLGKSAEYIYSRLPQPKPGKDGNGGGAGNGQPQPGKGKPDPAGEVRDAPTGKDADGEPASTESDWKQRTAAAAQSAKMQGKLPGGLSRLIETALVTRVDIKSLLLRFFTERVKSDYSWTRPNPRYVSSGLYLPALDSVSMGEVAILCDTSGSVTGPALQFAKGILEQVLDEVRPSGITLYFVDTKIHGTHRMEPGDPLTWEPKGFGGTNFTSFFKEIEQSENPPVCIVGISDLAATFGDAPTAPVLWITDTPGATAPFGEVVFVDR